MVTVETPCRSCGEALEGDDKSVCETCIAILGVAKATLMPDVTDPAACPRCGQEKERADWLCCIACAVHWDDDATAAFERAYDELGAWIEEAMAVMETMSQDDPRWPKAHAKYTKRVRTWKALKWYLMKPLGVTA